MTSATQRPVRLDSLTGVRFFAAFLVFGFHGMHRASGSEFDFFGAGMVGVSLFYILSGFVMAWTARPGDTALHFYRRRLARIYPAYLVAWALSLLMLAGSGRLGFVDIVAPPTLLQAWVPVEVVYFAGSAVFWSLSCEAFFYAVFPFLHRSMSRCSDRIIIVCALMASAVSVVAAVSALGAGETSFTRWFLIIFPPLRLMEFVVGVALGTLYRRGLRLRIPLIFTVPLALLSVVASAYVPFSMSRFATTLVPFILLVCSLANADLTGRRSVFRWRIFVSLGEWSYCFYLLHAMVLAVIFTVAGFLLGYGRDVSSLMTWILFLVALSVSVVCAWLLHVAVERPAEKVLRPGSTLAAYNG